MILWVFWQRFTHLQNLILILNHLVILAKWKGWYYSVIMNLRLSSKQFCAVTFHPYPSACEFLEWCEMESCLVSQPTNQVSFSLEAKCVGGFGFSTKLKLFTKNDWCFLGQPVSRLKIHWIKFVDVKDWYFLKYKVRLLNTHLSLSSLQHCFKDQK